MAYKQSLLLGTSNSFNVKYISYTFIVQPQKQQMSEQAKEST